MTSYEQALFAAQDVLGRHLIEATPSTWKRAILNAERLAQTGGIHCSISNPEGHTEGVAATAELLQALAAVVDVFRTHEKEVWRRMRFEAHEESSGDWRFQVSYDYSPPRTD